MPNWDKTQCLERIKQQETDYLAHYKLSQIYRKEKNNDKELKSLLRVQKHNKQFNQRQVLLSIGEIFRKKKDFKNAVSYYIKVYKIRNDVDIKVKVGLCLEGKNKLKEAQKIYETVISKVPTHWRALFRLGSLLIKQGQIRRGIDELQKARSVNMKNIELNLELAKAYMLDKNDVSQNKRNVQLSRELLEELIRNDKNNITAKELLANIYESMKKYKYAIHEIEGVVQR